MELKQQGILSKLSSRGQFKTISSIALAVVIFTLLILYLPDTFSQPAKLMTAIVSLGIVLWALEPIPLGLTALIVLLLMLLLNVADSTVIYSGFASPATYLIVGGMMLAKAVNETSLVKRVTYKIVGKWGGRPSGLLGSLIIIQQIQAFFIPSTAVRSTLILPISTMVIHTVDAKPESNLRKMIMLGVAFGGNISGTAVMTAAIGNILTVELLYKYAGVKITYFQWFLYTFPLWLLLIPSIWILLLKMYPLPKEQQSFPMIKSEMEERVRELGPVNSREIRCFVMLIAIVGLWLTEPLHGMHPSIPALIGVVLMTLPGIGFANWETVIKINYDTVFLLSVTLSMGYALIDSGTAEIISDYLSRSFLLSLVQHPLLAVVLIVIMTQIAHKMISNVSTAVVTVIPIIISLAANANVDPLVMGFTAGLTSLFGFVLIVETMPNLLAHSTKLISQKDFLKPGLYATILSIIATIVVAATWWRIIGLI